MMSWVSPVSPGLTKLTGLSGAHHKLSWTSLPRDRALEQDILELIRSRTGNSSPEENPDGA